MLREWRAQRALRAQATGYVKTLFAEPPDEDVRWLAANGTGGDLDHARWELRYARRALGLLTAQRDALDDRTGSAVAAALGRALARDPAIAPGRLRIAERQLNARLRSYGDALLRREGAGTGWHLGRALLDFAGRKEGSTPDVVAKAGDVLARYLSESNEALREHFGAPRLAEDATANATGY
ncbi:MAG TPA: hypothetical protein VFH14_11575 [Gemmatimonadaceae bacterium]|nr:hypothetical protein [Gemmatimonadaceae bacterium]